MVKSPGRDLGSQKEVMQDWGILRQWSSGQNAGCWPIEEMDRRLSLGSRTCKPMGRSQIPSHRCGSVPVHSSRWDKTSNLGSEKEAQRNNIENLDSHSASVEAQEAWLENRASMVGDTCETERRR